MSSRIEGVVKNASLAEPLANVAITVLDPSGSSPVQGWTNQEGKFSMELEGPVSVLIFELEGYQTKTVDMPLPESGVIRLLENVLLGYHDQIYAHPGETVEAKIHAPAPYRATLYRHGLQKETIFSKDFGMSTPQRVPDGYFVADGLNWNTTFEYKIPSTAQPGIYSLLLEAENYESFAIPLAVSTPPGKMEKSHKRLLYLCSTNNWQTYNIWGGRSRYRNYETDRSADYMKTTGPLAELMASAAEKLPQGLVMRAKEVLNMKQNDPEWVFDPLSVKRPHTNCALEDEHPFEAFTNHLAGGEWRVLAWLERENFDVDVTTGVELHHHPKMLEHYDGIILSTHSEYWSADMFEALKKYHRENGLWIFNVSVNPIYLQVDFEEDGSIRCLSTRFHRTVEDETQVIGVRFTESDYGTCAAYQIKDPGHWIFEGLDDQQRKKNFEFGRKSLNHWTSPKFSRYDPGRPGVASGLTGEGASGWETDKLSGTAPDNFHVVAKGQNHWGGADMVVREAEGKRGGVFSASSITFGGSLFCDEVCSRVLKNALEKALNP